MLNRRRQDFISHYIITKNATKSAKLAGYSEKTAYSTGQRLLKVDEIRKVIEDAFAKSRDENFLDKPNYVQRTYELFLEEQKPEVKARYWEWLGLIIGHKIDKSEVKSIEDVNPVEATDKLLKQAEEVIAKRKEHV